MAYTEFRKNNLPDILSKEWLVTNGIGGYASSSICGANTRKYHGLLVASLNPPTSRYVVVSKIDEAVIMDGGTIIPLSTNQYPGAIQPEGYLQLESFQRAPIPTFVFQSDYFTIEKNLFMPYLHNTTVVEYKNTGDRPVKLRLSPLFSYRDYHHLFHQNDWYVFSYEATKRGLKIMPSADSKPVYWQWTKGGFHEERHWHKNLEYQQELNRGLGAIEDAYHLGYVISELQPGESVYTIFSMEESMLEASPAELKVQELQRMEKLIPAGVSNEYYKDLIKSIDQFVVHRKSTDCFTIIAGYHWFTDWGRDTMISLLGATIALGKKEETTSIMTTFLKYLNQGMVPNRFPDREHDEPEYNTVDATLWLFVAAYEYDRKFHDDEFLKMVYPHFRDVLLHHIKGTRYNIHLNDRGFIWAGDSTTQLTWMDARIGDYVVTPRFGCPVEINALWYNALQIFSYISERIQQVPDIDVKGLIEKFTKNFEPAFWNPEGYLNDIVLDHGNIDTAIRPNQLYAISLPFPLVDKEKQLKICRTVERHLLTNLGLRSLSPDHHLFRATYGGNAWDRDTAYHQGTVWPFLISEYMLALLKAYDYSDASKTTCKSIIHGFKDHFYNDSGIHCISEIFDGKEPRQGRGCIQQAWSLAALLRVLDKADMLLEK